MQRPSYLHLLQNNENISETVTGTSGARVSASGEILLTDSNRHFLGSFHCHPTDVQANARGEPALDRFVVRA